MLEPTFSDVRLGSKTVLTAPKRYFRSTPNNGHHQTGPLGPVRANMYGPGRALQDRSSKTDERESCNNVSGL